MPASVIIIIGKLFWSDIILPSCLNCTQKGINLWKCGLCIETNFFLKFKCQIVKSVFFFFFFSFFLKPFLGALGMKVDHFRLFFLV